MRAKALENLEVGLLLLDLGFDDAAANRLYYAAFQAAIYALERKGFNPSDFRYGARRWGHGMVGRHLALARGSESDVRIFFKLRRLRERADYDRGSVERPEIGTWAPEAARFVREVTK